MHAGPSPVADQISHKAVRQRLQGGHRMDQEMHIGAKMNWKQHWYRQPCARNAWCQMQALYTATFLP